MTLCLRSWSRPGRFASLPTRANKASANIGAGLVQFPLDADIVPGLARPAKALSPPFEHTTSQGSRRRAGTTTMRGIAQQVTFITPKADVHHSTGHPWDGTLISGYVRSIEAPSRQLQRPVKPPPVKLAAINPPPVAPVHGILCPRRPPYSPQATYPGSISPRPMSRSAKICRNGRDHSGRLSRHMGTSGWAGTSGFARYIAAPRCSGRNTRPFAV